MYINITDTKTADNKGSSSALVHYLEKENRLYPKVEDERWFNHSGDNHESFEVRKRIDANIAKLGRNDAKFFLINISPSQKELGHLRDTFGDHEISRALKRYGVAVMDEYAKNFNRSGINDAKNLLWYAKIEQHRYYTYADNEVKNGSKKRGEFKTGDQTHIQVIVSRKDLLNKLKLSPMNSSRGKNIEHSKKMGQFNRVAFKQCGETVFDKMFGFDRGLKDTMDYSNIRKNGTIEQRQQLDVLLLGEARMPADSKVIIHTAKEISLGKFDALQNMLSALRSTVSAFLDIMTDPGPTVGASPSPDEPKKRRKKKKGQKNDQSMNRGF